MNTWPESGKGSQKLTGACWTCGAIIVTVSRKLLCIRHPLRCPLCPSTAFLVFVVLPPHSLLEASSGARPHDSRNSSLTPTCVIGFQPPALAGPISGSTHSSFGYKSLQGMPFGLSGSAHGSFLWYVVGRTRSGEQERQQKRLPLALPSPL